MKTSQYKLEDIKRGNQVYFNRKYVDNYELWWTVIGFYNGMILVKVKEMGRDNEIYIDTEDISSLMRVDDTRFEFRD